jgi:N-acetylmuramoyl-L-alanine amidase
MVKIQKNGGKLLPRIVRLFLLLCISSVSLNAYGEQDSQVVSVSLEGSWLSLSTSEIYPPRIQVATEETPPTVFVDLIGAVLSQKEMELPQGGLVKELTLWQYKYNPMVVRLAIVCTKPVHYSVYRQKSDGGYSAIKVHLQALDETEVNPNDNTYSLMKEPTSTSTVLAELTKGSQVQVMGSSGDWLQIRTEDGLEGWIPAGQVRIKDNRAIPGSIRAWIVEYAQSYLGVPYLYGGQSREGMDCSGLVQLVYSQVNISIPRGSGEQYDQSIRIKREELLPGDLIFFSTTAEGPSHVGIYIGGDSFIHAESSDAGVTITRFDAPYWRDRIYGFGKYLQ